MEIIKSEIINDPAGVGYADKTALEIAALFNQPGAGGDKVDNNHSSGDSIFSAVDLEELNASGTSEQSALIYSFIQTGVNPQKSIMNLRLMIGSWDNIPNTSAAFMSLTYRDASRAEVLGLKPVTPQSVNKALGVIQYPKDLTPPQVNYQNANGTTKLMYSAKGGYVNEVKRLLNLGADVDIKNNGEWTALKLVQAKIVNHSSPDLLEIEQLLMGGN